MKQIYLALATSTLAVAALAQDRREMDAHIHGVSTVEIAVEHGVVKISILSPGMNIVGFEYEATAAEDKDAVAAAIQQFLRPEEIVILPDPAGCRLAEVLVPLHTGDHDHDEMHGDHDDEHGKDHVEDEGHDQEKQSGDEDHDHDEESGGSRHSEFHVTYGLACDNEDALTAIGFTFFERFENAEKIEVQYVTESGAGRAELTPGSSEVLFE